MSEQQVPQPYVTGGCTQTDTAGGEASHFVDAAEMVEGRKDDVGKPRMDLIPPEVPYALGRVLEFGAHKYADRNWEKGFAWGRSVAALKRHLAAWEAGQDIDPESGMPHLWHVLTNAAFLTTFEARGTGTDDRPKGCALHLWGGTKEARQ